MFRSFNSGYFSALLSSILFGTMPVFGKSLTSVNPLILSLLISITTMLITIPLTIPMKLTVDKKNLLLILILACLGTVLAPNIYLLGLHNSSSSDAAILSNSEIIFTIIFAIIIFKEKFKKSNYVPLILISAGVLIISTKLDFTNLWINFNWSNLLIIISMLFWSFDNNISKIITQKLNSIQIVQIKTIIGSIIILLIIFISKSDIYVNANITHTLILSVISFGVPMILLYNAIRKIGTIMSILVLATSPIFGIIYSVIFLNENIYDYQLLSIVIMISGIIILYKYEKN